MANLAEEKLIMAKLMIGNIIMPKPTTTKVIMAKLMIIKLIMATINHE
jgi:hypothetical protein